MKKYFIIGMLFLTFLFLFSFHTVNANSIKSINMDVYLDSNGNASITEVWDTYLEQGTEGYRSYTNLGNSKISNFTLSDDSGRTYESLSNWNTDASFHSKAYKSGIHPISNGVELCWGISNYGSRTYTLKYNISNLVTQYKDTQGIYFNFIHLNQRISNAKITIHSDQSFSTDNAKIWAFGNDGTIQFVNNAIVLDSGGSLSTSQYMVGLIKFEENLFYTTNKSSKSFQSVYDSAMKDVTERNSKKNTEVNHYSSDFSSPSTKIFPHFFVLLLFFAFVISRKIYDWSGQLDFGTYGKSIPSEKEIDYWREIPCNKDLEKAYWVCLKYNVIDASTLKQGILGAVLLKWIRDGSISVSKTRKGLFSFKDNNYAIDFSNMTRAENEIEYQLFQMLLTASGNNKILEAKEFEKWCEKNYSKVDSWFSNIKKKEQFYLENQGLITTVKKEVAGIFGTKRTLIVKSVNPQLREEAIKLSGLKKFLLDYSLMPEREFIEVHLWEEYLIFAQLFGIADKVEEQFSKLYPNFNEQTLLSTDLATIAIRNMTEMGYACVTEQLYRASTRSSSSRDYRDYGGGGSSYSSGGRSSGGSSGGGFR